MPMPSKHGRERPALARATEATTTTRTAANLKLGRARSTNSPSRGTMRTRGGAARSSRDSIGSTPVGLRCRVRREGWRVVTHRLRVAVGRDWCRGPEIPIEPSLLGGCSSLPARAGARRSATRLLAWRGPSDADEHRIPDRPAEPGWCPRAGMACRVRGVPVPRRRDMHGTKLEDDGRTGPVDWLERLVIPNRLSPR